MKFALKLLVILLSIYSFLTISATAQQRKPNFIVILTDDQGYADLGAFGGHHVATPNLDKMAAEGSKLTNFYVGGSICTPSRAALLTGSYPVRNGMADRVYLANDKYGLHSNEITIAELLKSADYKTGLFGKWHLGDHPDFMPTMQGFDEFFGLPYSHDIHPFHPNKKHNFPPLPLMEMEKVIETDPDADYLTRRITERAVEFIANHKDQPFFLYLAHPIPHRPIHMSKKFMKNVPESIKSVLKNEVGVDYKTRDKLYNASISEIDWSVGQVLEALKTQGIDENTLVVFTSDNGPSVGSAVPLSGKKGSSYEGGVRVPAIVRWPGTIKAGSQHAQIVTAMDLLPTFAALAEVAIPNDRVIDGKNILPVLLNNQPSPHQAIFYHTKRHLDAVRAGKWKLHLGNPKGTAKHQLHRGKGAVSAMPALYNLETDIAERNNLITEFPEVVKQLKALADDFKKSLKNHSRPVGQIEGH
ncbi:sulfatase [Gayadomonas joobiniege]|uniref:sulfatase family protein n=1 Tax=Gayadomonas joobiniege TaxID=1234606 RepID=UPI0003684C6C|nr:sulfatase [Gayadomonas joobiniege]